MRTFASAAPPSTATTAAAGRAATYLARRRRHRRPRGQPLRPPACPTRAATRGFRVALDPPRSAGRPHPRRRHRPADRGPFHRRLAALFPTHRRLRRRRPLPRWRRGGLVHRVDGRAPGPTSPARRLFARGRPSAFAATCSSPRPLAARARLALEDHPRATRATPRQGARSSGKFHPLPLHAPAESRGARHPSTTSSARARALRVLLHRDGRDVRTPTSRRATSPASSAAPSTATAFLRDPPRATCTLVEVVGPSALVTFDPDAPYRRGPAAARGSLAEVDAMVEALRMRPLAALAADFDLRDQAHIARIWAVLRHPLRPASARRQAARTNPARRSRAPVVPGEARRRCRGAGARGRGHRGRSSARGQGLPAGHGERTPPGRLVRAAQELALDDVPPARGTLPARRAFLPWLRLRPERRADPFAPHCPPRGRALHGLPLRRRRAVRRRPRRPPQAPRRPPRRQGRRPPDAPPAAWGCTGAARGALPFAPCPAAPTTLHDDPVGSVPPRWVRGLRGDPRAPPSARARCSRWIHTHALGGRPRADDLRRPHVAREARVVVARDARGGARVPPRRRRHARKVLGLPAARVGHGGDGAHPARARRRDDDDETRPSSPADRACGVAARR